MNGSDLSEPTPPPIIRTHPIMKQLALATLIASAALVDNKNQSSISSGADKPENANKPKVLILDEPMRGVDVGAKMTIYRAIKDLAEQGVAVIVVSSELEEVLGLSHRVLVMSGGRQRGIINRADATPEAVMQLAIDPQSQEASSAA